MPSSCWKAFAPGISKYKNEWIGSKNCLLWKHWDSFFFNWIAPILSTIRVSWKAAEEWSLAVMFCRLHNITLTTVFPLECTRADNWLHFTCFVQNHQYPKQQVIRCLTSPQFTCKTLLQLIALSCTQIRTQYSHAQMHTHALKCTLVHPNSHSHIHMNTQALKCTLTYSNAQSCTLLHTHALKRTFIHSNAHSHTQMHSHALTCTEICTVTHIKCTLIHSNAWNVIVEISHSETTCQPNQSKQVSLEFPGINSLWIWVTTKEFELWSVRVSSTWPHEWSIICDP